MKIYADFQNTDADGRIRLNTAGTLEDLARHRLTLVEGAPITLYTDDGDRDDGLTAVGVLAKSRDGGWAVAVATVAPTGAEFQQS